MFGFSLASLDIRQHSRRHEAALTEVLRTAGEADDYAALPEHERVALLYRLILDPAAHQEPDARWTDATSDVLEVLDKENPKGVIVQYGGQTPLKLARDLEAAGAPIIGTTPDCIDLAEDRERFQQLIHELGLKQPPNRLARAPEEAVELAEEIGYPLVVRPSYVLGGRAMEIVYNESDLKTYMRDAVRVSNDAHV